MLKHHYTERATLQYNDKSIQETCSLIYIIILFVMIFSPIYHHEEREGMLCSCLKKLAGSTAQSSREPPTYQSLHANQPSKFIDSNVKISIIHVCFSRVF